MTMQQNNAARIAREIFDAARNAEDVRSLSGEEHLDALDEEITRGLNRRCPCERSFNVVCYYTRELSDDYRAAYGR